MSNMKPIPKLLYFGSHPQPQARTPEAPQRSPLPLQPRRGRPPGIKSSKKSITPLQSKLRTMITGMRRPSSCNIFRPITPTATSSTVTSSFSTAPRPRPPPSATVTSFKHVTAKEKPVSSETETGSSEDSSDEPPTPPRARSKSVSTPVTPRARSKSVSVSTPVTPRRKRLGSEQGPSSAATTPGSDTSPESTKPRERGPIVIPKGPPRFADHYLYSIVPFHMVEKHGGSLESYRKRSPEFKTLIGNPLMSFINNPDLKHARMMRSAWNETFVKVLQARVTPFHVISSELDFTFFNLSYIPNGKPGHLIFWKCDNYTLLKISQELGALKFNIKSVAFVQCDLGGREDTQIILGWWLNTGNLKAMSISNCDLKDQLSDDFFQELFPPGSTSGLGIERLEIETNCENVSLSQLFFYVPSVVSMSQRYGCVCPMERYIEGQERVHYYPLNLSRLIQDRAESIPVPGSPYPDHWEELEWENSRIPKDEMMSTFKALSYPGNTLETLSVKMKYFNKATDLEMYRNFFKSAKNLESFEIKGPLSSVNCDGTEVPRILSLLSPIRNDIRHISIVDVETDVPTTKRLLLKEGLAPFEYLESVHLSNCDFFDINESLIEFVYSRPSRKEKVEPHFYTSLTQLEIRGLKEVDWSMVGRIADNFPLLTKLDISGINTRVIPKGPRDFCTAGTSLIEHEQKKCLRHPVQLIFLKCGLLQELCMDDLEIWDEDLWAGLDLGVSMRWLKGDRSAKTAFPTLADLKYLEKLSLSRTFVSNITVRCLRFIPGMKFLNISYTHVNAIGIGTARKDNPLLRIIAEECNLSKFQESEFQSTSHVLDFDQEEPEDLSVASRKDCPPPPKKARRLKKEKEEETNWRQDQIMEIQKQLEIQKRADLQKERERQKQNESMEQFRNGGVNSPRGRKYFAPMGRRRMLINGTLPSTGKSFREFYDSL